MKPEELITTNVPVKLLQFASDLVMIESILQSSLYLPDFANWTNSVKIVTSALQN